MTHSYLTLLYVADVSSAESAQQPAGLQVSTCLIQPSPASETFHPYREFMCVATLSS